MSKRGFLVPGLDGPEPAAALHPMDQGNRASATFLGFDQGEEPEAEELSEAEARAIESMAREICAGALGRLAPEARTEFVAFWDSPLSADLKVWIVEHAGVLTYLRYGLWAWAVWDWWQQRQKAKAQQSQEVKEQ